MRWPPLWKSEAMLTTLPVDAKVTRFDMEFLSGEIHKYFLAYEHEGKSKYSQVTETCYFREVRLLNQAKDYEITIRDMRQSTNEKLRAQKRRLDDLRDENKYLKEKFKAYVDWVMQRPNVGDEIPF